MTEHNFTFVFDALEDWEEWIDPLFEAGCDDALFSMTGPTPILEFDRDASSLNEAIASAVEDVRSAGLLGKLVHIGPSDDVSLSEIARRAKVSREAVRKWADGTRLDGFPSPKSAVAESWVWSWSDVASWCVARRGVDVAIARQAQVLREWNLGLTLHNTPQRVLDGAIDCLESLAMSSSTVTFYSSTGTIQALPGSLMVDASRFGWPQEEADEDEDVSLDNLFYLPMHQQVTR